MPQSRAIEHPPTLGGGVAAAVVVWGVLAAVAVPRECLGQAAATPKPAATPAVAPASKPAPAAKPVGGIPEGAVWHDVTAFGVEGRGFAADERKRWFDRFPARAEEKVPAAVWNLSRDSAGMVVRFETDANAMYARYTLAKPQVGMPHMPATGVSGLDLYARDDSGRWKWVMVTKPTAQKVEQVVVAGLRPGMREYAAYLPKRRSCGTG